MASPKRFMMRPDTIPTPGMVLVLEELENVDKELVEKLDGCCKLARRWMPTRCKLRLSVPSEASVSIDTREGGVAVPTRMIVGAEAEHTDWRCATLTLPGFGVY